MKVAFSPCPNDTFIFHAWVHNLIPEAPQLEVTYADINITNELATTLAGPDLLKISYAALPWVHSDYKLIPCGGALGRGCGPLILTKEAHQDPAHLRGKKIAVPSKKSTAYLLFRLWLAQNVPEGVAEIIVYPFDEIMPAIRDGQVDAGLVIHEARFTYPSYQLHSHIDLGNWWEQDTGLPIPLGAIIAKRSLDTEQITKWIQASLTYAWQHPSASTEYILQHAQELAPDVVQAHIDLYVNNFSLELGESGVQAVDTLLTRAYEENLTPRVDLSSLLSK